MSLIRWQPFKEMDSLRQQMNQMFDELAQGNFESAKSRRQSMQWSPAIEIQETDGEIVLKAEVPGVNAKDLDVQVSEDAVSISGKHEEEKRTEEKGFFQSELRYGQFQRVIPLPSTVNHQQVKANFKDGILTLTLPKVEAAQHKFVKVDLSERQRELTTQHRQQEELRQDQLHVRAEERAQAGDLDQAMRDSVTEQRQAEERSQDKTHMRSETSTESMHSHSGS